MIIITIIIIDNNMITWLFIYHLIGISNVTCRVVSWMKLDVVNGSQNAWHVSDLMETRLRPTRTLYDGPPLSSSQVCAVQRSREHSVWYWSDCRSSQEGFDWATRLPTGFLSCSSVCCDSHGLHSRYSQGRFVGYHVWVVSVAKRNLPWPCPVLPLRARGTGD